MLRRTPGGYGAYLLHGDDATGDLDAARRRRSVDLGGTTGCGSPRT
jgi:hypothetical protein